ncbi:MAG: dipeptide epimerase [Candidatus Nanohaloarchaea archaeon]|nr:dipeptide epimerase [Candidatus Nanohaloarchaea archaeon]
MAEITDVSVEELSLPLAEPFEFALGQIEEVDNVLVRVETADGTIGYGEASPFPTVTGETQQTAMAIVDAATPLIEREETASYGPVIDDVRSTFSGNVNALFAIETAILDAYCRERDMPLSAVFGDVPSTVQTDITLGIVDPDVARQLTRTARDHGYSELKIKTGGDVSKDVARVAAVSDEAPDAGIAVDANQGYSPKEAVRFMDALHDRGIDIDLLEQPVPADDYDGLKLVTDTVDVPVAADESAFDPQDAMRIARKRAADVINIKLGKAGLMGASDIIGIAQAADLDLMIGCMFESKLGIHTAAHVVAGTGAFGHVDLDGKDRAIEELESTGLGPDIDIDGPGHGVRPDDIRD